LCTSSLNVSRLLKGQFTLKYVLAYLNGIQDVGVFVSTVFSILAFFGQTGVVCQSYNAVLGVPPQRACTDKS